MSKVFSTQGSLSVGCVDWQIVLVQRDEYGNEQRVELSAQAVDFLLPILRQVKGN